MAWLDLHGPLWEPDSMIFKHSDDFITLAEDAECSWLDGLIEDSLDRFLPKKFMEVCKPCKTNNHRMSRERRVC